MIRPNTYVLACNGAMIYDLEERLVYDGVCDDRLYDLIDRAFALDVGYHSVLLYMADNPVEDGHEIYTKEEYLANRASFCGRPAHKAVMITTDSASGLLGS